MTKALIIVDVQNDFIDGSLAVKGGEDVALRIRDLVVNGSDGDPDYDYIVTTQDWHKDPGDHWSETPDFKDSWPKHCEAGTEGAELHADLKDLNFDGKFFKGHYSASYSGFEATKTPVGGGQAGTKLAVWLRERNVTDVDVVGLALDYCVKATALDAARLELKTRVLLPYTAAVSPEGAVTAVADLVDARVELV
jgi:nicotinamidase/pyrazinamidase